MLENVSYTECIIAGVSVAIGLTLAAAVARQYPFSDRLILFLTPSFFIAIGASAEQIRRWLSRYSKSLGLAAPALIAASARLYGSGTPFYRLLLRLHVEAGTSRPYLADTARTVQRRQHDYMTQLVEAGQQDGSIRTDVDPRALGQTINAVMQGFLVQQLEPVAEQRRATEAFAELLERLIV